MLYLHFVPFYFSFYNLCFNQSFNLYQLWPFVLIKYLTRWGDKGPRLTEAVDKQY